MADEIAAASALKASLADALAGDPDLLLDTIEGETGLLEIVDALLLADLHDAEMIEGLKRAKDTIDIRRKRFEARVALRRALIEQAMLIVEREKLERPTATLSLISRPPAVEVVEEADIPARFFKSKPVLDKDALKAALAAGEEVSGARMTNGSQSLTIRRR